MGFTIHYRVKWCFVNKYDSQFYAIMCIILGALLQYQWQGAFILKIDSIHSVFLLQIITLTFLVSPFLLKMSCSLIALLLAMSIWKFCERGENLPDGTNPLLGFWKRPKMTFGGTWDDIGQSAEQGCLVSRPEMIWGDGKMGGGGGRGEGGCESERSLGEASERWDWTLGHNSQTSLWPKKKVEGQLNLVKVLVAYAEYTPCHPKS